MTVRRRRLLWLLPVLLGLLLLGSIGTVELALWVALLMLWAWAFVFWGRRRGDTQ